MKCSVCNSEMKKNRETYHYTESGLDNIFLENTTVYRCGCGEEFASIYGIIDLNTSIGIALIKKQNFLSSSEIKFLRKNIGLNAATLAEYMGVNKAAVLRWENGEQQIDKSNDRIIRLIYASLKQISPEKTADIVERVFRSINHGTENLCIHIPYSSNDNPLIS